MDTVNTRKEKRKFFRYDFNRPLTYKKIDPSEAANLLSDVSNAISKNLSACGILFITRTSKAPSISSLLSLAVDYKTATVCEEIEKHILILDDKLIGKVVRIEDNEDGTCGVGIAFVTKTDPIAKKIN